MQKLKVETRGCPRCTMQCGHRIKDTDGESQSHSGNVTALPYLFASKLLR
jgi:aldehyde:ferredoxin oxidoreductase